MKPILSRLAGLASTRIVLISGMAGLLIWGALAMAPQPLIIRVDGQPLACKSLYRTVGAVLAEAGVKLGPKDAVQPDPGSAVARGMVITVNRAVSVRVNVDGKSMLVLTPKAPVRDVLQTARVNLGSLDRVSLPPAQMVADGTVITVNRIAKQVVTENYQLPVPVERMDDPNMERGASRVVRAGTPGQAQRSVQVTYVDGHPAGRVLLKDQVVRTPVSKLIAFGTVSTVSRGGNTIRFRQALNALATAYSYANGRYTYTGRPAKFGVVAVDPRVIPLGSRLYVEGYGYATAADIGSAIKGNRIDVFFESERDCQRWGLRSTKVYVLN